MSFFSGRPLSTVISVIAVSVDDMALDCEDDERVHAWVYAPAWQARRAFLTGGTELLRARLTHDGHDPIWIATVLGGSIATQALMGYAEQLLLRQHFFVKFTGPDDEADAGERIEFTDIRIPPPFEEVERRLGIR